MHKMRRYQENPEINWIKSCKEYKNKNKLILIF